MKAILLPMVTLLMLGGCASSQAELPTGSVAAQSAEKIIVGKTTKAQVRQVYGAPTSASMVDGGEAYTYHTSNLPPLVGGLAGVVPGAYKASMFLVMFDANGIVKAVQRY